MLIVTGGLLGGFAVGQKVVTLRIVGSQHFGSSALFHFHVALPKSFRIDPNDFVPLKSFGLWVCWGSPTLSVRTVTLISEALSSLLSLSLSIASLSAFRVSSVFMRNPFFCARNWVTVTVLSSAESLRRRKCHWRGSLWDFREQNLRSELPIPFISLRQITKL